MIIAVQQPEHFPWVGFFNKMARVDELIYLDNVQFKKRYFENRNRICTRTGGKGWDWITVPVVTKSLFTQKINKVEIDYTQDWQRKYLNKIRANYGKSPFFKEIFPYIETIVNTRHKRLVELNLALIDFVKSYLRINTPAVCASQVCDGKGSSLILELCVKRGADAYLSGPDGRNYLKSDTFAEKNIAIFFHDYEHPVYQQASGQFLPYMSIADLIFNHGVSAIDIVKKT